MSSLKILAHLKNEKERLHSGETTVSPLLPTVNDKNDQQSPKPHHFDHPLYIAGNSNHQGLSQKHKNMIGPNSCIAVNISSNLSLIPVVPRF